MSKNYTGGLSIGGFPTSGETGWAEALDDAMTRISAHDHSEVHQRGKQIPETGIADNAVTSSKIRLNNNVSLRARNAASSADIDLLALDSNNILEIERVARLSSTETLTSSGAISVATNLTILNGATLAMTLAAGQEGQLKFVANIASTSATVTPASSLGANTVTLGQYGNALFFFLSGEWRILAGPSAVISDDSQSLAAAGTWNGVSKLMICTGTTYTVTTPAGADGQTVMVRNQASGNVTFGGAVMATGTYYLYSYLNAGWRRVALT